MRGSVVAGAVALGAALAGADGAEPRRRELPVWDANLPSPESLTGNNCNVAVVRGLRHERRLLVRAGPGANYPVTGSLRGGTTVFTCNEASRRPENGGRRWLGVAFAGPGKPCNEAGADGLEVRRSVHCRTGWVGADWVTILSG